MPLAKKLKKMIVKKCLLFTSNLTLTPLILRFPKSSPLTIEVDPLSASTKQLAIGEAVELALYNFDAFKTNKKDEALKPEVKLLNGSAEEDEAFRKGRILGNSGQVWKWDVLISFTYCSRLLNWLYKLIYDGV